MSDSYDVYSDASENGFGCMLLLNGKVFVYVLRKWKTYEVSYSTHKLDLDAIMLLLRLEDVTYSKRSVVVDGSLTFEVNFNLRGLNMCQIR